MRFHTMNYSFFEGMSKNLGGIRFIKDLRDMIKEYKSTMSFLPVNYSFFSDKVSSSRRIVLISDLHDIFGKPKKANGLIEAVNSLGGHHVSIAGDTMQGHKYSDKKYIDGLAYFLDGLSEEQLVTLSLGNHDLVSLTDEGRANFRNIGRHNPNIIPLDNETVVKDEFRITGFSSGREAYAGSNHHSGKANLLFAKDWNAANIMVNYDSRYFEELVGHAPHPLASPYVQQNATGISNMDLYLTGHLHNGYLPIEMPDWMMHSIKDKGIWEMPLAIYADGRKKINPVYEKIDLCRGMHSVGPNGIISTTLSDGVTFYKKEDTAKAPRLVVSGGINRFFGLPCTGEITVIDILPEQSKSR